MSVPPHGPGARIPRKDFACDDQGMEFPATGRRVLITGASRGLGRAAAHAFAANGDRVAVHYGTREDDARHTLAALPGSGHVLVGGDLSDPAVAAEVTGRAADGLGGIDVLVNNAAVMRGPHSLPGTPYEEWVAVWQQHVAVNLLATAQVSHLAGRRMIDAGNGGRIVNIGSRGRSAASPTTRRTARPRRPYTRSASRWPSRSPRTESGSRRSPPVSSRRSGWRTG